MKGSETHDVLVQANFEDLVRRYSAPLRRFFQRRVSETADIDDLIQEVFLRLIRRGDLGDIANLQGFLFQTASNILRDRQRQRVCRRTDFHLPVTDDLAEDSSFSPERVLVGKEDMERFTMALVELPERTRTIFVLCRLEGFTHAAAAAALGISTRAVDGHIGRALEHLLARMNSQT